MNSNERNQAEIFGLLENLLDIGIALSAEKDRDILLEMILTEARRITNADAGTLYLREKDCLTFKILHNKTMNSFQGGKGAPVNMPPVKLIKQNVSAYVALTGKTVNIADVYEAEEFDFSGPRNYDKITGYRTKSMLVVPMENHESQVIGVLQLINAMDANSEIIPFADRYQRIIESLASQAAIALTNAKLVEDIEQLFHSFVQTITTAIDAQTPYNANHSMRVALLAGELALAINESEEEIWRDKKFSKERHEQLVMAGWLHDIGKVATPLSVMNKSTRLEDGLNTVLMRFDYIYQAKTAEYYKERSRLLEHGSHTQLDDLEARFQAELNGIVEARDLIEKANHPGTFIDDEIAAALIEVASH